MSEQADPAAIANDCIKTLDRVHDGLRWAFSAGWYPGRRWIGEARGAEMRIARPESDDRVKGAKHDIGMGDHRARETVRAAGPRLSKASEEVGKVLGVCVVAFDLRLCPRSVGTVTFDGISTIDTAVRRLDHQLDFVTACPMVPQFNHLALRWATDHMRRAESLLGAVNGSLARWADSVPESRTVDLPLCVTCGRRPRPLRRGVVVGRECDTCATYRYRHKGQARPKSLDKDDRQAVIDAAGRRAAAGQGWGMG